MLASITTLLAYQLAGELLVLLSGLPVPGPVLGMALLFASLAVRRSVPAALTDTSQGLLAHLSLLFVPAGVGVMVHFDRLQREWLPVAGALLVSTVLSLVVAAVAMRVIQRLSGPAAQDGPEDGR